MRRIYIAGAQTRQPLRMGYTIMAEEGSVPPVVVERSLDHASHPKMVYENRSPESKLGVVHSGQLKLLCIETDFLSKNAQKGDTVVYCGGGGVEHLGMLSRMFPLVTVHVYDINVPYVTQRKQTINGNVRFMQRKLNEEDIAKYAEDRASVLLVSDIRAHSSAKTLLLQGSHPSILPKGCSGAAYAAAMPDACEEHGGGWTTVRRPNSFGGAAVRRGGKPPLYGVYSSGKFVKNADKGNEKSGGPGQKADGTRDCGTHDNDLPAKVNPFHANQPHQQKRPVVSDDDVVADLLSQEKCITEIRARGAMVKFRLPYNGYEDLEYVSGEMMLQPFTQRSSTEVRLYVSPPDPATGLYNKTRYNCLDHEQCMFYHNSVTRMSHRQQQPLDGKEDPFLTASSTDTLSYDESLAHAILTEWADRVRSDRDMLLLDAECSDGDHGLAAEEHVANIVRDLDHSYGRALLLRKSSFANLVHQPAHRPALQSGGGNDGSA